MKDLVVGVEAPEMFCLPGRALLLAAWTFDNSSPHYLGVCICRFSSRQRRFVYEIPG
jgi:hypothetical protein